MNEKDDDSDDEIGDFINRINNNNVIPNYSNKNNINLNIENNN